MVTKGRPLALIILDGWGYSEESEANAIMAAKKPYWDYLWKTYPHTLISASGRCVGLPDGQMGNSEVGHLTMGAGRIVHQDLTRIDVAIEDASFFKNKPLVKAIEESVKNKKALHILILLSPGGVHSHENHLFALLKLGALHAAKEVYIHAFLDGRDTPPQSALLSIQKLERICSEYHCGNIASIIGRYYAMDRDNRWQRVQKAYGLVAEGHGEFSSSTAQAGLEAAYSRGETDEFVKPTTIIHAPIQEGDNIIFMNFRADRARELTRAFIDPNFTGFPRKRFINLKYYVTLTEYDKTFNVMVAFPQEKLTNILSEYLSRLGLRQLRIAETEKYAHVTFFFNGGIETPFPGEDRILIPSPKVATYDLKPEMNAYQVTDELIGEIKKNKYDVIICNFANPDMIGHTGNFKAAIQAIEIIDNCLSKIIPTLLSIGGQAIITADHGNAEIMFDKKTQQPHTAHTLELVPFLYIGNHAKVTFGEGRLSDIAPTMLYALRLPQPNEMTGKSLIEFTN